MAMTVHARDGALAFRSDSYFLRLFGRSSKLPGWLSPGTDDGDAFRTRQRPFRSSRWRSRIQPSGVLIRQSAAFQEAKP